VTAGDLIDKAAAARNRIVVSAISLAEIVYLIEKNRLPARAYAGMKAALDDPDHGFKEAPFTVEIVDAMKQVPRADVPDMPDRIVAATAVYFDIPVLSRDGKIHASNVRIIW
jgi:PIN domain nuclease of toxin-antitoxin system